MKTLLLLCTIVVALAGCSKSNEAKPTSTVSLLGSWTLEGATYVNTFTDGRPAASGSVTYAPGRYRRVFTADSVRLYSHDTLVFNLPYTFQHDSLYIPPSNPNAILELTSSRLVYQSRFASVGVIYTTTTTAIR